MSVIRSAAGSAPDRNRPVRSQPVGRDSADNASVIGTHKCYSYAHPGSRHIH